MHDNPSSAPRLQRREMLALLALAGAGTGAPASAASRQDTHVKPTTGSVETFARLVGDISGRVTLGYTAGTVWGFRPQADDLTLEDFARRIYGYKSLIARKVRRLDNGDFAVKQQAWTFYTDPTTDAITATLHNPYTGVDVTPASPPSRPWETAYQSNGVEYLPGQEGVSPLGEGQSTPFDNPFDMRIRSIGDQSFVNTSQFIRFQAANITWHKLEATLFSYACRTAELTNTDLTHVPSTWSMNLVAEWQTWMDMHGSPGHILFKGEGAPVAELSETPADFQAALADHYPGQLDAALAW